MKPGKVTFPDHLVTGGTEPGVQGRCPLQRGVPPAFLCRRSPAQHRSWPGRSGAWEPASLRCCCCWSHGEQQGTGPHRLWRDSHLARRIFRRHVRPPEGDVGMSDKTSSWYNYDNGDFYPHIFNSFKVVLWHPSPVSYSELSGGPYFHPVLSKTEGSAERGQACPGAAQPKVTADHLSLCSLPFK